MDSEGSFIMTPPQFNILIVKLSAIGDVIHTLPSLRALRKLYPEAHITWVVEAAAADLVQGHPDLNRVLIFNRKQWIARLKKGRLLRKTFAEIRQFLKLLHDRPYDLVIDFHGLFKSSIVVWLSRGKRKLGYDSMQELSGLFLNEKITEDMGKHAVDRYLDFIKHLGGQPVKETDFLVAIGPENVKKVKTLLQANDITGEEQFIAISPTALWDTKMWEDDKFAELCDRLIRETGEKLVFTGAADDHAIQRIRSMMREKSVDLSGRTSLKDLAYLFQLAAVVITTDSGPMHLAAAVKTPVVALFGPTAPERTGPYGSNHTVVRTGIACSPCFFEKMRVKNLHEGNFCRSSVSSC